MMKQVFFIFLIIYAYLPSIFGQKVGINITNPESALDIHGDLVLRSAELTLMDGQNIAVDVTANPFSNYRIIGPTAPFSLDGIGAGVDGRIMMLFNRSSNVMTVTNESMDALPIDQVLTGTGTNVDIPHNGSVTLQYDGSVQKWVIRNIQTTANSNVPGWSLTGNSNTDANINFVGTTDGQPLVLKSGNNTMAFFQHNFPSNNYIGANYQRTGIGILGNGAPTHTLEIGLADIAGGSAGVLGVRGTTYMTHFNYGVDENTYIRAGKTGGNILLNDLSGLGKVGVGTSTPYAKLDVVGDGQFFSSPMTTGPVFTTSGGALRIFNSSDYKGLIFDGSMMQAEKPKPFPGFGTDASTFTINPYGGAVGIGTNYPLGFAKLEVFTSPESRALAVGDGTIGLVHFIGGANRTTNSLGGYFGTNSNHPLHFYTNSQWAQMTLLQNGNLGIGTTNPSHKLSVNGTIRSQEVIVETANWPDYVFGAQYHLPPLRQVEQFIETNHHLPNVPSATQMAEKGIALGDMQKILMEKIEELTLYIIAQNKRIETLESKK